MKFSVRNSDILNVSVQKHGYHHFFLFLFLVNVIKRPLVKCSGKKKKNLRVLFFLPYIAADAAFNFFLVVHFHLRLQRCINVQQQVGQQEVELEFVVIRIV